MMTLLVNKIEQIDQINTAFLFLWSVLTASIYIEQASLRLIFMDPKLRLLYSEIIVQMLSFDYLTRYY